jgi:hypothetical protein
MTIRLQERMSQSKGRYKRSRVFAGSSEEHCFQQNQLLSICYRVSMHAAQFKGWVASGSEISLTWPPAHCLSVLNQTYSILSFSLEALHHGNARCQPLGLSRSRACSLWGRLVTEKGKTHHRTLFSSAKSHYPMLNSSLSLPSNSFGHPLSLSSFFFF